MYNDIDYRVYFSELFTGSTNIHDSVTRSLVEDFDLRFTRREMGMDAGWS